MGHFVAVITHEVPVQALHCTPYVNTVIGYADDAHWLARTPKTQLAIGNQAKEY